MRESIGVALATLVMFGSTMPARAQSTAQQLQPPFVTVSAHGEIRVVPDRALVVLSVETRAPSAAAASQSNAAKQTAVLSALKALGLSSSQIGTQGYSVIPETRNDTETHAPRVVSYRVINSIRVELTDIGDVGKVIDTALGKGANSVSGIQFYESNAEELYQKALARAVANAKAEGSAMASALGGHLGALRELTTGGAGWPSPVPQSSRALMALASTPISPGTDNVRASVTVRWTFVPGS